MDLALLDAIQKHYGPGPHKTGTPQSVHRGTLPGWFDDVSLIQSHVRDRPEIAEEVEEWALGRIDELRGEMSNASSEREKKAIGEEVHALTTVWATAYNVRTSGYAEGKLPPDIKRKFDRWYESYHAENLAERERRSREFTTATEGGGVQYIPYRDRISGDDDFLAPLIDTNIPGGRPFVQDAVDIQPGAVVFGPTGPFRVEDKIGPKVSDLPSYPPGGEASRPHGLARPRASVTAPVGRPADLSPDHTRLIGRDSTGRRINLDLPYDGIAPPYIPDHRVRDIERLFTKIAKHGAGSHEEKHHGNWATGTAGAASTLDPQSQAPSTMNATAGQSSQDPQAFLSNVSMPPAEDPNLVRETYEQAITAYGPRMEQITTMAGLEQMSVPGQRRGMDTMGMYGMWQGNEFLGWSADRVQLQSQILAEMEATQIMENDGIAPGTDRQAIVMAGLPGSGKTFLLNNKLGEHFDLRQYVRVNADEIKEHLVRPEFGPPQIADFEGMELASMVHEESSAMSKFWEADLINRGQNIALDITAANRDKTMARIARLQENGYTVHVVHADISVDESVASSLKRAGESSTIPGKLGRPVPPGFIRSMATESGRDTIDDAFPDYTSAATGSVFWFRNYPISRGDPALVYSRPAQAPQLLETG